MVEFALPKNSKITTGKTWPKPEGATNVSAPRAVSPPYSIKGLPPRTLLINPFSAAFVDP